MEQQTYEALKRPQSAKLKQMGKGWRVGQVSGARLLVKTVKPWTVADEVEKKGVLYVPETVKDANTPLPSIGLVVQLGTGIVEVDSWDDCMAPEIVANDLKLKEGVAVMFSKFAGADITVEEEDFRIISYKEILCTLELTDPVALEG